MVSTVGVGKKGGVGGSKGGVVSRLDDVGFCNAKQYNLGRIDE